MNNTFTLVTERIEGTNIIYSKVSGELSDDVTDMIYRENEKIAATFDDPNDIRLLVDARESGKAYSKARKQFSGVLKKKEIKKIAVLGNKPFLKAMLTFYRIVAGVDKIRSFSLKDDAIAWLKE